MLVDEVQGYILYVGKIMYRAPQTRANSHVLSRLPIGGETRGTGRFEKFWTFKLDPTPGLTVVEIMESIHNGDIRAMYIMGETQRCQIQMCVMRGKPLPLSTI